MTRYSLAGCPVRIAARVPGGVLVYHSDPGGVWTKAWDATDEIGPFASNAARVFACCLAVALKREAPLDPLADLPPHLTERLP